MYFCNEFGHCLPYMAIFSTFLCTSATSLATAFRTSRFFGVILVGGNGGNFGGPVDRGKFFGGNKKKLCQGRAVKGRPQIWVVGWTDPLGGRSGNLRTGKMSERSRWRTAKTTSRKRGVGVPPEGSKTVQKHPRSASRRQYHRMMIQNSTPNTTFESKIIESCYTQI